MISTICTFIFIFTAIGIFVISQLSAKNEKMARIEQLLSVVMLVAGIVELISSYFL